MRISSKGRYAIAALTEMALNESGRYITVSTLAHRLSISKLYLEQVFSLLKRSGLVLSGKGAQGGYLLRDKPKNITIWAILSATELPLSERTAKDTDGLTPELGELVAQLVYAPLDEAICGSLASVSLADLSAALREKRDGGGMYYI